MVDVTDQLSQYATRLGDQIEPVELDEIEAIVHQQGNGGVSVLNLSPESAGSKRWPVVLAAAAAALVVVASVGVFLLIRDDDPTDVVTTPDPATTVTTEPGNDVRTGPPPSPFGPSYGYEPGWTELDGGPLAPRQGAATVWTGHTLLVVGGTNHTDGAAYQPEIGRWRPIADPPVAVGGYMNPSTAWTGSEALVLGRPSGQGAGGQVAFVAYDPWANSWRRLADAPPITSGPGALVWTGTEAILVGASAAYDPATDTWRSIDLPIPMPGYGASVAWTGDVLVQAVTGAPTVVYDPTTDSITYLDPPPNHGVDIEGGVVGGLAAFGDVVIVDEEGRASSLDLGTGAWTAEAIIETGSDPCQPVGYSLDDGRSVWDLCGRMWIRSFEGTWVAAGDGETTCCMRGTVSTGGALLAWVSNDDAVNDPSAPRKALWAWVPPEAPTPMVVLEDGTYEGHIKQVTLGPDHHVVTIELLEFFFGDDAAERAMADGAIDQPDGLPNPHYVRSVDLPVVLLEAGREAEVWVLNDTRDGVRLAPWDELAIDDGEPRGQLASPISHFPVEIVIEDGVVVEIRQFYVP
jgi:hypothetical protein